MDEITEDDMKYVFKRFDTNGDGRISPSELAEALRSFGCDSTDEIERRMSEIDTDKDGFIDYDEVVSFVKAHPELAMVVVQAFKDWGG